MRLRTYMLHCDVGTRSRILELLASGKVMVNGEVQKDGNYHVDVVSTFVEADGQVLNYRKNVYIMMNKPRGYVSATASRHYKTVMDILPAWSAQRGVRPIGDTDKKITGLVFLTDDEAFYHFMKAQRRNINRVYHIQTNKPVTIKHAEAFASGMKLKHFAGEIATLSRADSYYRDEHAARLTMRESSYHNIQRMFKVLGIDVISVEVIAIDNLVLPPDMKQGQWRELKSDELHTLRLDNPYI